MKHLLITFFLMLAVITVCKAQDNYYQVTTDSTLAFKLAFADFQENQHLPNTAYCEGYHFAIFGGVAVMAVGAFGATYGFFKTVWGDNSDYIFIQSGAIFVSGVIVLATGLILRNSCLKSKKVKKQKKEYQQENKDNW